MDTQYFKELLNSRSLKATSTRLNLLTAMHQYESAMPYSAIQKAFKSIDRVTLYRTLESLKEQGVIHKAFQENKDTYFAICGMKCGENHHHHDHVHFKCEKCNAVTCEKLSNNVELFIPGHLINNVTINIEGVCKLCN